MGALIAGASIATLPYSADVISKVGHVKDFFVTLFFVALGMGIPAPDGPGILVVALAIGAAAISARYLVFFPLLFVTGLDRRSSFVTSTKLAQISEFCLVIAYIGMTLGHVSDAFVSTVIFAFVPTALLCPVLFQAGDRLHDRFGPWLTRIGFREPGSERHEGEEETYDVALLGVHRVASSLLEELRRREPEGMSRTLVVDFNVGIHAKIAETGATVRYGDLSNPDSLHHLGIENAAVIVCSIPDDLLKGTTNRKLVRAVRTAAPKATILVNASDLRETMPLYDAGADFVYHDRLEVGRFLADAVGSAVRGELDDFRARREAEHGSTATRSEVIP